jgi:hypothetical protein
MRCEMTQGTGREAQSSTLDCSLSVRNSSEEKIPVGRNPGKKAEKGSQE